VKQIVKLVKFCCTSLLRLVKNIIYYFSNFVGCAQVPAAADDILLPSLLLPSPLLLLGSSSGAAALQLHAGVQPHHPPGLPLLPLPLLPVRQSQAQSTEVSQFRYFFKLYFGWAALLISFS
jgi:hypothetical protein